MKITFFLGGLSGGGTERVVCNLSSYLAGKGHSVEILTMADDAPSYYLSPSVNRVPLIRQNERRSFIFNSILRIKRLKTYMKTASTDRYVVMLPTTIVLMLLMHRYAGAPIIVSERADPSRISGVKQFLLKRLVKYASGFVFQTEDACKWYKPYIQNAKVKVIPNAVNGEFIRNDLQTVQRGKKIAAVGRFTDQKNFELLINAFARVHTDHPDYELFLYGDGPKRERYMQLADSLNLTDHIHMPGYVNNIGTELSDAALFVLSSDFEGIPNSLMEAMALGIPCVSTDCPVGGPRSLINSGDNGILVPAGSVEDMANAMLFVINDPENAQELGRNAKKIIENLNPEKIYRQWELFICGQSLSNK